MRPLPVLAIVREAWTFTFTHLGAIIGLIWLPMVIYTVSGFFVRQHFIQVAAAAGPEDMATLGPAVLGMVIFLIAALLLSAMMWVSVVQLALGQRQGGGIARLSLGPVEWRMFRALLGLVLFLMPPAVGLLLLLNGAAMGAMPVAGPMAMVAEGVLALLACGAIFVLLRFGFLLPAVVVGEDKPALARSWVLSAGHFWTILGIAVCTMGASELISAMLQVAVAQGMGQAPVAAPAATTLSAALAQSGSVNLPLATGLTFLLAPLMLGLSAGASAFTYRALTKTDISI